MNREQHLKLLEEKMKRNLEIARAKNNDYCGEGVDADPFKNFRISEQAGVPVEKGILVRMYDKMSRVSTLLNSTGEVKDESVQDTLSDLSNYALILSNFLDSKKPVKKHPDACDLGLCIHDKCRKPFIGINDIVEITDPGDELFGARGRVVDAHNDEITNNSEFVVKIAGKRIIYSGEHLCKI